MACEGAVAFMSQLCSHQVFAKCVFFVQCKRCMICVDFCVLEVLAFGFGLFCCSRFKWMSCVNLVDLDYFSNREVDERTHGMFWEGEVQ